jgi:pyridoxal phosphate enzyme (YggS family)
MSEPISHLDILSHLKSVQEKITLAERACGRESGSVNLVVVTKSRPLELIRGAVQAGARNLGENYPQEATKKILSLHYPDVTWHMIGHVQSRKAAIVVKGFSILHSLDSLRLAERLEKHLSGLNKVLKTLIELNVSHEESKYGFSAWDQNALEATCQEIGKIACMKHIIISGLMTMPPATIDPEQSRPYFVKLRFCQDYFHKKFPLLNWNDLSMGTSSDYIIAIQEGSTWVRIGQAIFGPLSPVT